MVGWFGLNGSSDLTRRVSEILKTRDWLQLFRNNNPQVVVVANDDKLNNVNTFTAVRTGTGTTNLTAAATSPSQVWVTALSISMEGVATATVSTAAIRGVRDGQTITLAIIGLEGALGNLGVANSISHDFSHPVRVDAGTNISLTTVQSSAITIHGTVHTVTNKI